ncbi:MAG: hypothetical protein V3T31_00675 [candidate division Zixibacteria bacterium]
MFRILKVLTILAMISLLNIADIQAQESTDEERSTLYDIPPRRLVDMPTAGTLPRGYFSLGMRLHANGGVLGRTTIGLSNRFMIGISFGGDTVLSNQDIDWNPNIEFNLKFRVVDELPYLPAMSIGFSSQGYGSYHDEQQRYTFKSRGFFAVASRSFYFYKWTAGWHGGINYGLSDVEEVEAVEDKDLNLFVGFDATFNYNLAFLIEYDFAFNDNRKTNDFAGRQRGYLNMSFKWLFTKRLEIELLAKDMFVNRKEASTFGRGLRLTYIDHF